MLRECLRFFGNRLSSDPRKHKGVGGRRLAVLAPGKDLHRGRFIPSIHRFRVQAASERVPIL